MGRDDWYRNTDWTEEVKAAFYERLERSRSSCQKAQYLRIQAHYLQHTGEKQNVLTAKEMLDLLFEKCPEPSQLALSHLQYAQCLEYLHDYRVALDSYRRSIEAENNYKTSQVGAVLYFSWFVVERSMKEYYDEVLTLLKIDDTWLVWPISQFKYSSIFAIILDEKGEVDQAKGFAKTALESMVKEESPFPYHKKLGLVENPNKKIVRKLKKIAKGK